MKKMNPNISTLITHANNCLKILEQNRKFYLSFKENEFTSLGKSTVSAMVLSQIFVDFYTCIETFLFRVSQEFENNLSSEHWHKELLQKMSISIHSIRPEIVSKQTANQLFELLLFRHFLRYYFDFDYDWEKLEFIEKKYQQVYADLLDDIQKCIEFLETIETTKM
jgi:hypothetical protein